MKFPPFYVPRSLKKVSSFGRSSTGNYRVQLRGNFVSPFLHQTIEKEKETGNEVADIFMKDLLNSYKLLRFH